MIHVSRFMRVDRLFFTVLAVPLDFAVVVAAGLLAWSLRSSSFVQSIRPIAFEIRFSEYLVLVLLAAAFTVFMIATAGLYRFPRSDVGSFWLVLRIGLAVSGTLAAIALAVFFRQELFGSRFLVLAGWIFSTLFLIFERSALLIFERWLARKYGIGLRRALVVGVDSLTNRFIAEVARDPASGLRIVKQLSEPNLFAVEASVAELGAEAIILADPNFSRDAVLPLIDFANERHLALLIIPNLFQALTANAVVGLVGDIPVVELRRTALEGWGRVAKRISDVLVSLFAILLFMPLFLLIGVLIKLDDPQGPVIYRNRRAGQFGKEFSTLKFRTMGWKYATGLGAPNPEWAIALERELAQKRSARRGPVWKILDDPRRTRVGRFIERTSLDELPQFFNVLKGEMSIVGPRPHMLEQVEAYEKHHKRVFALKPGITGLAQISGRSDLDFDAEVRLDTYYIENWSLLLDLKIMLKTPFVVLFRKHRS